METIELVQQMREYIDRCNNGERLSGIELSELVQLITHYEIQEGGPYGILLFGKREADLGLNLLINEFLQCQGVSLPNVISYITKALAARTIESSLFSIAELHQLIKLFTRRSESFEESSHVAAGKGYQSDERQEKMLTRIRECISLNLYSYPEYVQTVVTKAIARTIEKNVDRQMTLMCYFLRESLGEKGAYFSDEYIAKLGAANVYFWTSFIIYDDFWDCDEEANPALLPIANILARNFVEYFSSLPIPHASFRVEVQQIMEYVDVANAWETQFCRMEVNGGVLTVPVSLPDYDSYQMKYYPASAHFIGPVLMLRQLGFGKASSPSQALELYFQNYLICMQINDDLHDWKEDLSRGHLSTVVVKLLNEWKGKYPDRMYIDVKKDLDLLEELFWERVLLDMSREVLLYATKSRAALKECSAIVDIKPLEQFISRNEHVANAALGYYSWSEDFLESMEVAR